MRILIQSVPISNEIINFAYIVENSNYKETYVNAFCLEAIDIRIAFRRKGNGRVRR